MFREEKKLEELKKEYKEVSEKNFVNEMVDGWTSENYRIDKETKNEMNKLKKEINKLEIEKARAIIDMMNEPTEWMKGRIFSCQINFENPDVFEGIDETSFDIDCTKRGWRDELLELWIDFCKDCNFEVGSITDAWSTICDDEEE